MIVVKAGPRPERAGRVPWKAFKCEAGLPDKVIYPVHARWLYAILWMPKRQVFRVLKDAHYRAGAVREYIIMSAIYKQVADCQILPDATAVLAKWLEEDMKP